MRVMCARASYEPDQYIFCFTLKVRQIPEKKGSIQMFELVFKSVREREGGVTPD